MHAYVNGTFLPLERATVSVLDRGFLFADGIYEVVPVYAGQPFRLIPHLARLQRSLDGIRLANPLTQAAWAGLCNELIERSGGGDLSLYLQVTRGACERRDHHFPESPSPTVVGFCQSRKAPPADVLENGIAVVTLPDSRWAQCWIKSVALLPNVLAKDDALNRGGAEAILIRDGRVVEGASSNVYVVSEGHAYTPPLGRDVLSGITREVLLELAGNGDLPLTEAPVTVEMLRRADEVWISSSTRDVLAVTRLDGEPVGDGRPGSLWAHAYDALQGAKLA